MWESIKRDAQRYGEGHFIKALSHPGFRTTLIWRDFCALRARRVPLIAGILRQLNLLLHNCDLSANAIVGAGIKLPHPTSIIVGDFVKIETDVTLMQSSTLGGNFGKARGGRQVPTLGQGTFIGPGASVLGPVSIAENSIVGANQVITRDNPKK